MFWKTIVISACGAAIFSSLPRSSPIAGKSQPTYTSESHFSVKRSSIDVAPDGDLSKVFWKNADFVEFDQDAWGKSHYPEVSTRVKSLWTDSYIYFGFLGRYDSLNTYGDEDPAPERWQLWNRDVVEVFLNPQPERVQHYYEFEVAPITSGSISKSTRPKSRSTARLGTRALNMQPASMPKIISGQRRCAYPSPRSMSVHYVRAPGGEPISFAQQDKAVMITESSLHGASFQEERHFTRRLGLGFWRL